MLTQDQLLQLFIQQNIPLTGRRTVETIRESDPIRRVGGGTKNVVTRFASTKMGCVIQAESHKGELPLVYQWEHDPDTLEFYDQPSRVKLSYKGATGRLTSHLSTPDYFLIQPKWMGWIEYKPEEELEKLLEKGSERFIRDGKGGWRCPSGETFAAQYGLGFQVLTQKNFNWMLVRNLEFLSDYLDFEFPQPAQTERDAIFAAFAHDRWLLLQTLLAQEGVAADAIYALIAREALFVDLQTELLSEPGFTYVCKDELSSKVYRESKQRSTACPMVPLHTVQLSSGTPVLWDGNPWKILNVGNSDVYLEDENHAISTLALETFQSLVSRGEIVGLPAEPESRHKLADDILKHASPIDLESAVRRVNCLDASVHHRSRIPSRTLRYWRKRAHEGEVCYGNSFAGLVPRISARGNRERKVAREVIEIMEAIIDTEVLTPSANNISVCYGMVINSCTEKGIVPPSDKTFRAEIKKRREEEVVLARQGEKAAYRITEFQWIVDQGTPRHGERPFEIGHIDHTELDEQCVDSSTGANLGKPWLTVLLDAFTRMVLAFFITFDPPSYRSCMSVIRNCVRRHGRIPRTIVADRGSDFESLYYEALLARLGTHKKSRPGSKARFGTLVERYFGVTNQAFIHNLAGNNKALQKPRSMSASHDPRDLAVWTLPALTDAFENFTDNIYANMIHPALAMSPKQQMARGIAMAGARAHVLIPYTEDFIRLSMPTTPARKAVVRPGCGIKIKGIFYWSPEFRDAKVERTKVDLVYDPFDISRAYTLVKGQWVLCRSEYQSLFERRTEREIAAISQEIRRVRYFAEARRGVKASEIAAFILQMREKETALLQQRRDAQVQARLPVIPDESQQTATHLSSPENAWAGTVAIEYFEELK